MNIKRKLMNDLIKKQLALLLTGMITTLAWAQNPVVKVEGGLLQGIPSAASEITVFKGIPYAAPPVGELRWKRPQPVAKWDGVKVADTFSNICWQPGNAVGTFYGNEFYWKEQTVQSEDCLYLNIWTPTNAVGQPDRKLPVAFWVHGGAYFNGYGHEITMDGDAWASRGVILVTINYRLGIFGFLAHPELSAESADGTSGNYGTYDQVAALKWVYENIAQFGGDPKNITVLGQSAGAASIKNLVSSPLSKGMIKNAVIQTECICRIVVFCPAASDHVFTDIIISSGGSIIVTGQGFYNQIRERGAFFLHSKPALDYIGIVCIDLPDVDIGIEACTLYTRCYDFQPTIVVKVGEGIVPGRFPWVQESPLVIVIHDQLFLLVCRHGRHCSRHGGSCRNKRRRFGRGSRMGGFNGRNRFCKRGGSNGLDIICIPAAG